MAKCKMPKKIFMPFPPLKAFQCFTTTPPPPPVSLNHKKIRESMGDFFYL